jgi:hypothetical protein
MHRGHLEMAECLGGILLSKPAGTHKMPMLRAGLLELLEQALALQETTASDYPRGLSEGKRGKVEIAQAHGRNVRPPSNVRFVVLTARSRQGL